LSDEKTPGFDASQDDKDFLGRQEWAICVATFYEDLAQSLVSGAVEGFAEGGVTVASIQTYEVPGAFELPFTAKICAGAGVFAGIACLGVVIRGETDHYDYVCSETARGIMDVGLASGVPASFGVITCDTREQAEARAGGDKRDQGRQAAYAVMRAALNRRKILG
jgi:6,7-dimethyl-8-ribityllumazine synthase